MRFELTDRRSNHLRSSGSILRGELATLLTPMFQTDELRRIRIWLAVFMVGLILSGLTAFPLATEIGWLNSLVHSGWLRPVAESTGLGDWIERVHKGLMRRTLVIRFLLMARTGSPSHTSC